MENFNDYIDISFDSEFKNTDLYTWLPWIGKEYLKSDIKTLILGESTYNWAKSKESIAKVAHRISKDNHLRIVHKNNAIDRNGKSLYAKNIERAILLKKKPKSLESNFIWKNVIYHNLVLRAMPTKKSRPKYIDYFNGWKVFIELAQRMDIEQCIVYGVEPRKLKSFKELLGLKNIHYTYEKLKPSIGRSYPRLMNITLRNKEVKILFIRHPSAYFSWEKWGLILNKELNIKGFVISNT